jgi:hypothetical protein
MPNFYEIPKGTRSTKCPLRCGAPVYWIEAPRRGGGTQRITIDASVPGGSEPDSLSPGRGVAHLAHCPNAEERD